ncbi:Sensor histidine kinase YycG [Bacillus sp. THAF10]|uniref:sensor histidine kinase n=1 Tax=Bacillus sp. THAF10 TaxID=2587848 RepID=UPI0012697C32|nr:HAMP domain-containing sensor histidine kinase [Bacillus sp. THAF10]QFT88184.1 Sensor histidine kinase YycG [Bacillus sp. THAF10]
MIKRKSIFIKLFLTSLLILSVSFMIFALIFNYLLHNVILKNYQETLYYQRDQLTNYINLMSEKGLERDILYESLALSLDKDDQTTYIFNANEEIAYLNKDNYLLSLVEKEDIQKALSNKEVKKKIKVNGRPMFLVALPMELKSETPSNHAMVVIFHGFDQDTNPIRFINLSAIAVTIILTGVIIYFASRKITAPLLELNRNVLEFAKGDFSNEVKINRQDEIGQLGASVNYMAKELAGLEKARRDFVANVSHDLRSPLTSINGFLTAIQDGTIPENRRNHYLSVMKNETNRLIKLVNDLLDITLFESNQLALSKESYNMVEQIRRVIAKMEPDLQKREIEMEFKSDSKEIKVFADMDRIEQVLTNLIHNSIHFSSKGSKVEVHLFTNEEANAVFIDIKDYGMGIDDKDLPFIWDRFFKADKSRSNKIGTGIGLSIVKQILDQHETVITVDSKVGKGTTFTFSLPISIKKS